MTRCHSCSETDPWCAAKLPWNWAQGASGGSPSGKVVIETPVKGIEIMKDEKVTGSRRATSGLLACVFGGLRAG